VSHLVVYLMHMTRSNHTSWYITCTWHVSWHILPM